MRLQRFVLATAALAAGLMTSYALAQERPIVEGARETVRGARDAVRDVGPRRVTANRPADGSATNPDHTIAQCLAIGNQEEIALGTLAAGKTQNPKVKQFAEMMAKDHGKLAAELEKFGATPVDLASVHGPRNADDTDASDREARTAERRERRDAAADRPAEQRTAARFDFVDAKRQMAQRCLENARQCWNEKPGHEADMAYIGSQVVLHQQMIDAQEVLRQYASPELQQVIDQGIESARSHLAHAKKLIDELAKNPQAGSQNANS